MKWQIIVKMKKYIKKRKTKTTDILGFINKWLIDITNLLTNVFVFAVICGLLFNDPFGVINTISTLISNVGEKGLAGFISLAIIILIYRRQNENNDEFGWYSNSKSIR